MNKTADAQTLLVLAAGMGSRYGGLKQIDPIGPSGETILDYSIHDARIAGFNKVVFVIRHSFEEEFRKNVGSRYEKLLEVKYVFQELDVLPEGFQCPEGREKPWGTGHAILVSESAIHEPFSVINADDFYGRDAFCVLSEFLRGAKQGGIPEYALVAYALRNTLSEHGSVSRGICTVDDGGHLTSIRERTSIEKDGNGALCMEGDDHVLKMSGDEPVSLNLWGFTPQLFSGLKTLFVNFLQERGQEMKSEFFIPFAVDEMLTTKKATVRVLRTDASWLGVTYREDKPIVQAALGRLIAEGVYPEQLFTL